jgi:hypothetical protein
MMAKKPLTPEQIAAGVAKNRSEYEARVAALRGLHEQKAYNPPIDAATLSKEAAEAARGAAGKPAMTLHGPGNEGDVKLAAPDKGAEAEAKAKRGGKRNVAAETVDEGEAQRQGEAGDGGVQAGQAAFGQQAWPQGAQPQAGNSHSAVPVWTEQTWEAESEEAVRALVPAGAKAVEVKQVWQATALVRQV